MVHASWFYNLRKVGLREKHSWLANLPSGIFRIANFGCWSGCEPFALMWTLDAHEVMVIEIENKYLDELNEQIEILSVTCPESLHGRKISSLLCDMTIPILELRDQYFDLAYCEDVLYSLPFQDGLGALERGLQQMIRVVKPNGFIIAVEPKFGVEFQSSPLRCFGVNLPFPIPITEPIDISSLFPSTCLRRIDIRGQPPFSYCYQKIESHVLSKLTCD